MAGDIGPPQPERQQNAPPADDERYDKLEERVRKIENAIARFYGAMSVIRWIVPPLLIVAGGVLVFFLGRAFS